MNAHRINTATGPQSGLMAWSCVAAVLKPQGMRVASAGSFELGAYRLDRSEGPMHPGEGSA